MEEAVSIAKGEAPADTELDCLIDIQTEAHIPEDYIENLSRRLEVYRRIADIRTESDASDVTDELIDRFGEVPEAVSGLINIALLRNKAQKLGIYEIKQQPDYLLLYVRQLKCEAVADIISRMKGRAMLNAVAKPYIAVRLKQGEDVRKLINEIIV